MLRPLRSSGRGSHVGQQFGVLVKVLVFSLLLGLNLALPSAEAVIPHGNRHLRRQRERPTVPVPPEAHPIRPKIQCPTRLEVLMPLLLRDLPGYTNRVNQREFPPQRTAEVPGYTQVPGYMVIAGPPEYEPLTLAASKYATVDATDIPQVFFTTLERQYLPQGRPQVMVHLQHYHWLFLTQTDDGWRLVLLLSTIGRGVSTESSEEISAQPFIEPATPPQDNSQGVTAQAIRLWLRDCAAGSIEGNVTRNAADNVGEP